MAIKSKAVLAEKMGVDEYKPTIEIDEKMYPKVTDLKVDEVVNLSLKVKVTSIRRDRWNNNKLCVSGTIENADPEKEDDMDEDD